MKLNRFLNYLYNENRTMLELMNATRPELEDLETKLVQYFNNTFAATADIDGIQRYERILNIIPDPSSESIEFRRGRVINKLGAFTPYTRRFLEEFLNIIFGEGNWALNIDHLKYEMFVHIDTDISELYIQTIKDIRQMIPANMMLELLREVIMDIQLAKTTTVINMQNWNTHITTPVRITVFIADVDDLWISEIDDLYISELECLLALEEIINRYTVIADADDLCISEIDELLVSEIEYVSNLQRRRI